MTLVEEMELVASGFGVSLNDARKRLRDIGMVDYAETFRSHLHFLYFAMASLAITKAENVLELGTLRGASTKVLAKLFPSAIVYTIDKIRINKRFGKNVIIINRNSFFLQSLNLPKEFDLVWVDGDHRLPIVACDIAFAYNNVKVGGFVFMHDYSVTSQSRTQVKDVVDYMNQWIQEEIQLLPASSKSSISENAKTVCIRRVK